MKPFILTLLMLASPLVHAENQGLDNVACFVNLDCAATTTSDVSQITSSLMGGVKNNTDLAIVVGKIRTRIAATPEGKVNYQNVLALQNEINVQANEYNEKLRALRTMHIVVGAAIGAGVGATIVGGAFFAREPLAKAIIAGVGINMGLTLSAVGAATGYASRYVLSDEELNEKFSDLNSK